MRHKKGGRKFSRKRDQRKALLKSLARALFLKEKIITSEARAKEVRALVERLINQAKRNDLSSKRFLGRYFDKDLIKKITSEIAPNYKARKGGCTRIVKLGQRKGDGAKMAIIELLR